MQKTILMKKTLFVSILLIATLSTSYSQNLAYSPLEQKWEIDYQGNYEDNFYNRDYCDYYLLFTNSNYYELHPGKNTVQRVTANNINSVRATMPDGYRYFKGKFIDNFNTEFLYSLPIRSGDSTRIRINTKERDLTFNFKIRSNDTIFATRGGTICLDDAMDMSSKYYNPKTGNKVLVYQNDCSFCEYKNLSHIFVLPGEQIKVGQAIGLAKKMADENSFTNLEVSFFFLDKNKVNNSDTGNKYSHYSPKFLTLNNGICKLEEKKLYLHALTDTLITQEMSKREKKRYFKKKAKLSLKDE